MSEKEKKIIEVIMEAAPKMSERQKGKIIGYGEAIIDLKEEKQLKEEKENVKTT